MMRCGTVPGPLHQIVAQVATAYGDWQNLERHGGSVSSEVVAANDLESLGRRLVVAPRAAPRLVGNTAALGRREPVRGAEAAELRGRLRRRGRPLRARAEPPGPEHRGPHPGLQSIPAYDRVAELPK